MNEAMEQDYINPVVDDGYLSNETTVSNDTQEYRSVLLVSEDDIAIYDTAFIGFSMVGIACMLCLGSKSILSLFKRVL